MQNYIIILWAFLMGFSKLIAQDKSRFYQKFTLTQYQADLDTFTYHILNTHPEPFAFTPEEEFLATIQKHRQALTDQSTLPEFLWMCSEIIAQLDCAHSSLGWFNQETRILPLELRFPLEARFIGEGLYVSDPLVNQDRVKPGQEIFSINGVDALELRDRIYRHINSQGKSIGYKRVTANGYFTAYIAYALGFPESYEILVKGQIEPIRLQALKSYKNKALIHPQDPCQDMLCLDFPQEKTARMSIRTFAYYGDKFPMFRDFMDQSFQEILAKGVENLIIDLRLNNGGPSDAGIYLLQYLSKQPFTYFAESAFGEKLEPIQPMSQVFGGQVFMLTDGNCGSTTAQVLSLSKKLNLATLIGEEIDGNQLCFGGQKRYEMPHTKIAYTVARYRYLTAATKFPLDKGIYADHPITQSIEDYLTNTDTVMEYTLELIANSHKK